MKKSLEELLIINIQEKNINEAKKIIDSGANIHYLNDLPLALSASLELDEMFFYLIEHDANVLSVNGRSLIIVSQNGQIDLVNFLLNKGMKRTIAEKYGNNLTLQFLQKKDLKDNLEKILKHKNLEKIIKI